jgi:hypothetical protein
VAYNNYKWLYVAEVHISVVADMQPASAKSHNFQFGGFIYLRDYFSAKNPFASRSMSWFKSLDEVLEKHSS